MAWLYITLQYPWDSIAVSISPHIIEFWKQRNQDLNRTEFQAPSLARSATNSLLVILYYIWLFLQVRLLTLSTTVTFWGIWGRTLSANSQHVGNTQVFHPQHCSCHSLPPYSSVLAGWSCCSQGNYQGGNTVPPLYASIVSLLHHFGF